MCVFGVCVLLYRVLFFLSDFLSFFSKGPVTTGFNVYSDWIHYRSGVYRATGGTEMGGHAVRIIGWGVEGGDKYDTYRG